MTLLLENPLPIWAAGAVLATLCLVVLMSRRTVGSLLALAGVVLVTILLAWLEAVVITEKEQVEVAVTEILAAIQKNDLQAVLDCIDPAAEAVRSDAERLMPMVNVRNTGSSSLQINLDDAESKPLHATASLRARIEGTHQRSGQRVFYFDEVMIDWIKRDEDWLVEDYQAKWRGRTISAVTSMRENRPVPGGRD